MMNNTSEYRPIYMITPHWAAIFAVGGEVILIIIQVAQWTVFRLSAVSTRVFAVEALLAGVIFDFVMRKKFHLKPMLFPKFKLTFIIFWVLMCIYVFIATPF